MGAWVVSALLTSAVAVGAATPVCKKAASKGCIEDAFSPIATTDSLAVFDHATAIVARCFYDRTFSGIDWPFEVRQARANVFASTPKKELQAILNGLLSKLRASHTQFLSDSDQRYWMLKAIFTGHIDGAPLRQVGAQFDRLSDKWFVRSVFEGSPAAAAGLVPGDEIVSVDASPLEPVDSFSRLEINACAEVRFRRAANGFVQRTCVTPVLESFQRTMLRGSYLSTRVIERGGKRIGYFRLWAGTHETFKRTLADAVAALEKKTDALVLDIRDGLGGASGAYLDPFFQTGAGAYTKPIYLLVNEGSKSGKETLAYLIKTRKRGVLVGTRTGGAYVGGRLFDIVAGRFAMYLAVCGDPPVGVPLEGIGVAPDVEVSSPLPYAQGVDAPLERALQLAAG